jgi:uncharacterized protein YjbJ (UPF0337 family)
VADLDATRAVHRPDLAVHHHVRHVFSRHDACRRGGQQYARSLAKEVHVKSNITKIAQAKVEVAAGSLQEAVGHAIGNEKMEAKGAAHQVTGHAREAAAKNAEHRKGVIEEVVGAAKNEAGHLIGDRGLQVTGKVEVLKGKARQAITK